MFQLHFLPPNNDELHISIVFPVGGIDDPKGKEGIVHFVEHLLFFKYLDDQKTYLSFIDVLYELGSWNAFTTYDYTQFYITSQSTYFVEVIDTLFRLCYSMEVTPEDFEKEKQIILYEMISSEQEQMKKDSPSSLLFKNVHKCTPYKTNIIGTKHSIMRIKYQDIYDFYNTHYQKSLIFVTAPKSLHKKIEKELNKHLTISPMAAQTFYDRNYKISSCRSRRHTFHSKEKTKDLFTFALVFTLESFKPDFIFSIEFLRYILSRITMYKFRFQKQATYSTFVEYEWYAFTGVFSIRVLTKDNETALALLTYMVEILKEVRKNPQYFYNEYIDNFKVEQEMMKNNYSIKAKLIMLVNIYKERSFQTIHELKVPSLEEFTKCIKHVLKYENLFTFTSTNQRRLKSSFVKLYKSLEM